MAEPGSRIELCRVDDVEEGGTLQVDAGDLELAVYRVNGEFYVTDDKCTHGPGSLSEGFLDGCIIECDFHNGAFDIRTGEVVAPPCTVALRTYDVTVQDGKLFIDVPG